MCHGLRLCQAPWDQTGPGVQEAKIQDILRENRQAMAEANKRAMNTMARNIGMMHDLVDKHGFKTHDDYRWDWADKIHSARHIRKVHQDHNAIYCYNCTRGSLVGLSGASRHHVMDM